MPKKRAPAVQPDWRKFREIEEKIGHAFADSRLLLRALTHVSYANERGQTNKHNERLEFLGDAVLSLCVSTELFKRFPQAREGRLTVMHDRLVCEQSLALRAREIGLGPAIRLGQGEACQNGSERPSLLADAFEALLAAVYLDGGLEAAARMVAKVFAEQWPRYAGAPKGKDPKSKVQEICQKTLCGLPVYELVQTEGRDHEKIFTVKLILPDGREFLGRDTSMKKAGQAAAASALQEILPAGSPLAGRPSMA